MTFGWSRSDSEVGGGELRAGRLESRRRHAGRQVHAEVHDRPLRRLEEIADALEPEHVGDLVRIADRGRDAVTAGRSGRTRAA